jgi:hypothetical protein
MKQKISVIITLLMAGTAWTAVYPLVGGPGLVHLQSAKTGQGIGYRSIAAISSYSGQNYYGTSGSRDALLDSWTYSSLCYAPLPNLSAISTGLAHAEQWNIKNDLPAGLTPDKTLGCPGDALVAIKYQMVLMNGKWDLGIMPMITIPMDRDKYVDAPSQTGRLDAGGKLLSDFNWNRMTMLANAGFLTRGEERPQLPFGLGLEYSLGEKYSAFLEASGEYRLGAVKDSLPDDWILRGRGADRHEFRLTPGFRFAPLALTGINISCDIGLTKAAAPWQAALGLDFPASAGRVLAKRVAGMVAGLIKDNASGLAMKGIISFPNQNIPSVISDASGNYKISLLPGKYKIQVKANGYRAIAREIEVKAGKISNWDLGLNRKTGRLTLKTADGSTQRPVAAGLTFDSNKLPAAKTDQIKGEYQADLDPGSYTVSISAPGYQTQTLTVSIKDKEDLVQQAWLRPLIVPAQPPKPVAPVSASPSVSPAKPITPAAKPAVRPPAPKPSAAVPKMTAEEITSLYKQGVQQFMNEEYSKAEQTFKKVLAADPNHTKAKEYLGKARDRLKKSKG